MWRIGDGMAATESQCWEVDLQLTFDQFSPCALRPDHFLRAHSVRWRRGFMLASTGNVSAHSRTPSEAVRTPSTRAPRLHEATPWLHRGYTEVAPRFTARTPYQKGMISGFIPPRYLIGVRAVSRCFRIFARNELALTTSKIPCSWPLNYFPDFMALE